MEQTLILDELNALIKEGYEKILPTKWKSEMFFGGHMVEGTIYTAWHTKTLVFLKTILYDNNDFVSSFAALKNNYYDMAVSSIKILESVEEYINKGFIINNESEPDLEKALLRIFSRFNRVARKLRSRHSGRNTLEVNDEYDVQDLLHALLTLYFDDIRDEEWTPSYAGKSARVDFLLKKEKTVIEVKKTRDGLGDKEVGDQLIIDVDRYKTHPDCNNLICFVYDPECRIGNPDGLMNDLNEQHKGFVKVIVEPTN